jgi:hypothetical protein
MELLRLTAPAADADDALSGVSLAGDLLGAEAPARPVYIELPEGPFNSLRRSVIDGAVIRTAWHRIESVPGWIVWVNEPESSYAAALGRPLTTLAIGGLLAFGMGIAAAVALSHGVLRPAEALVARLVAEERINDVVLVDVDATDGGWRPRSTRERVRAVGPSVRPDFALPSLPVDAI